MGSLSIETLGRLQGLLYLAEGLWPFFALQSFLRISGAGHVAKAHLRSGPLLLVGAALVIGPEARLQDKIILGLGTAVILLTLHLLQSAATSPRPFHVAGVLLNALFIGLWCSTIL